MTNPKSVHSSVLAAVHGEDWLDEGKAMRRRDSEIEAARAAGLQSGQADARKRFQAALGARGIKGDGVRMSMATDLLLSSPEMSGEDAVAFVLQHAAARLPNEAAIAAYEQGRLEAAGGERVGGAAMPDARGSASKLAGAAKSVYAARRSQVAGSAAKTGE